MDKHTLYPPASTLRWERQPGNGIKYVLFFTLLVGEADGECMGCVPDGYLVTCGITCRSYLFSAQRVAAPAYVAEKFSLRQADALVVAEMLNEFFGTAHG